jgi:hypothetical protein
MPTTLNHSKLEPLDDVAYSNGSDDRAEYDRPRRDQELVFTELLLWRCVGDL